MKKLLMFFLFTTLIYPQETSVYKPDGVQIKFPKNTTVGKILKTLDPKGITIQHIIKHEPLDEFTVIYYKFLTKESIFIITSKPELIKQSLDEYDFTNYMRSLLSEIDIDRFIKKKKLYDLYLINTLGNPDSIQKDVTGGSIFELWHYDLYNIVFKIKNSYVFGYMRLQ
jgi:hypothetical protein